MRMGLKGVLRVVVLIAIAASCATSAGTAPAPAECAPPQEQHWYSGLARVMKPQCWHLGSPDTAVQKSATSRSHLGSRGAAVRKRAPPRSQHRIAAASPRLARAPPAAAPPAEAIEPAPPAAPAAPALGPPMAPAAPPPLATVADPPVAPAPQAPAVRAIRSTDAVAPAAPSEPASTPAEAPRSAAIAPPSRSAPATASIREADRTYPLIVLATALLIIAGPVLAITRLVSIIMINLERRRAPAALAIAESVPTDIWEYGDLGSPWNQGHRISDDLANELIDLGHRAAQRRHAARSAAGVNGCR